MSKPKNYERGGFSGNSNPLDERHLETVENSEVKIRSIVVTDVEISKLRANNGRGQLKKHLYDTPFAINEVVTLHSDKETLKAKITAMPEGLSVGKKSTLIEVDLIEPTLK